MPKQQIMAAVITAAVGVGVGWVGSAFAAAASTPAEIAVLKSELKNLSEDVNKLTSAIENFNMRVDAILLEQRRNGR